MSDPSVTVARVLAAACNVPLTALPPASLATLLAHVLHHLLRGQPIARRLAELEGAAVALQIEAPARELVLAVRDGRLVAAPHARPDVAIRGTLDAFAALAARSEDADALFFHGRLSMSGDTAIGVHVKNLLDALEYDWDAHFRAVLPPGPAGLACAARRRVLEAIATLTRRVRHTSAATGGRMPGAPRQ